VTLINTIVEEVREAFIGPKRRTWAESARDTYAATMAGLKGYGGDALSNTARSFNEALPYIERAGYDVTEIEVGIGLSPKIVPHLQIREILDDEERAEILREVSNKRMVYTILHSLFRATAARKRLKFKQYHFTEIEMELSLLPTVTLKFKPNGGNRADRPDDLLEDAKTLGVLKDQEEELKDKISVLQDKGKPGPKKRKTTKKPKSKTS